MDIFKNPAVIWFIIGFVFFILEFAIPGFILFFFAVGAWITAIVLLFVDISINIQLVTFLAAAILSTVFFRKSLKRIMVTRKSPASEMEDEISGKTAIAETSFGPGQNGKVEFKGTSWNAKSEDIINKGEQVIIIGNESILLIVKSTIH